MSSITGASFFKRLQKNIVNRNETRNLYPETGSCNYYGCRCKEPQVNEDARSSILCLHFPALYSYIIVKHSKLALPCRRSSSHQTEELTRPI
jgi:hypothetical protein